MTDEKIIQRAIGTAKRLRQEADGQGVFATGNISGRATMKDGARAIEALVGLLRKGAEAHEQA